MSGANRLKSAYGNESCATKSSINQMCSTPVRVRSRAMFVSSSGFQLRQRFFSHVARKGFRFGKGVPLSLFGFAS